jgi:hypothetical protein
MKWAGWAMVGLAALLLMLNGFSGPLGALIFALDAPFLNTFQAGVQRHLSPELWNVLILPILESPSWLLPLVIAALFFVLARRRARGTG